MNFEDALEDILSDGSNDSFFEESTKVAAKRTKTPEKKSITELFNITETKTTKNNEDWLGLEQKEDDVPVNPKSPAKTPKLSKKISFEDDDILGNLGLGKKLQTPASEPRSIEVGAKSTKKIDILESILGTAPSASNRISEEIKRNDESFEDILKASKVANKIQSSKTEMESSLVTPSAREGRRGRRSSGGNIMDPLGLFSSDSKAEISEISSMKPKKDNLDTLLLANRPPTPIKEPQSISRATPSKSVPNISSEQALPDWLGGTPIKLAKSEGALTQLIPSSTSITDQKLSQDFQKQAEETESGIQIDDSTYNSFLTQQKLAQSNIEYQQTAFALQQQESQVLMALQMKKHDDRLVDMQMKQHEILMKQERQFSDLLERQFAKQQTMENNLKLQQERINNHIQVLLSQSSITKDPFLEEEKQLKKTANNEHVKIYEDMIATLKQRQHEEIFLMSESYKKQISLVEQSLESVEKRLKSDSENLTQTFENHIQTMTKQQEEEVAKYQRKIVEIEEQHANEIRQIRENHERVVDEIKHEYLTLIENIKESRRSETSIFGESRLYLEKLDGNLEILSKNNQNLIEIKESIERDHGILSTAREESLKGRENEIDLMRRTLEKCRESAEEERTQLLGLVRSLESKIAEQNQNAREERWALQQAASTFAARSLALDRETEFNRAAIQREKEQLQLMKDTILADQEKMILQFTEEKLAMSVEKSRFETTVKLQSATYDKQKTKSDVEAAIQIAQEAAEMTDKERERLHKQQSEAERMKRTLIDKERKLELKEKKVNDLLKEAEQKMAEGERAIYESKSTESKYNDRLMELQTQLTTLSTREKKLAEEKILLSKERLALNTLMRQSKRCALCSADAARLRDNLSDFSIINPNLRRFDDVANEISRLRLEETEQVGNVPIN